MDKLARPVRRLLQIGDLHLRSGELRDQLPVLRWVVDQVRQQSIDLVIVAGDLAGLACPHLSRPLERQALLEFCLGCLEHGGAQRIVVLRGNHDVVEDWRWLDAVPGIDYVTRPCTLAAPNLSLLCIPYPDRSWLAQRTTEGPGGVTEQMAQTLRRVLLGFQAEAPATLRRIVTGHFTTGGALASSGQPLIGQDVEVPTAWLRESGADLVLLNHIHLGQTFEQGRVVHVGSPWPTTFAESGETKRVCVVDVDEGPGVRFLATPCIARVNVDFTWADGHWAVTSPDLLDGLGPQVVNGWHLVASPPDRTYVKARLRYHEGDAIDDDMAALFPDARGIKIERLPERARRVRSEGVVRAGGPVNRFLAFEHEAEREVDEPLRALVERMTASAQAGRADGAPLRLRRVTMTDLGVEGTRQLDLTQLPDGIIALVGENGEGKTTLLEAACPGALFRVLPSRSPNGLIDLARSRSARLDVEYESDGEVFRFVHDLDGERRNADAHLYVDGVPYRNGDVESTGKRRVFDQLVAGRFPSWPLVAASRFLVQGGAGRWSALKPEERRSLLRQLLGLDALQTVAASAAELRKSTDAELVELTQMSGRLAELREECARLEDVESERGAGLTEAAEKARQLTADRDRLAEELAVSERAAHAVQARADLERRAELEQRSDQLGDQLAEADGVQRRLRAQVAELAAASREAAARLGQFSANWARWDKSSRRVDQLRDQVAALLPQVPEHRPDVDAAREAWKQAVRDAGEVRTARDTRSSALGRVDDAERELGQAREQATLAAEVPCRGEGPYAACPLLDRAVAARDRVPGLASTCERRRDEVPNNVTDADVEASDAAVSERHRAVQSTTKAAHLFDQLDELQVELATAAADVGEEPEAPIDDGSEARHEQAQAALSNAAAEAGRIQGEFGEVQTALRRMPPPGQLQADAALANTEVRPAADVRAEHTSVVDQLSGAERAVGRLTAEVAETERRLGQVRAAIDSIDPDVATHAAEAAAVVARCRRVTAAFGPSGIQAVLVDSAGPSIAERANELLEDAYEGVRFTLEIQTQRDRADGKGQVEVLDALVHDAHKGWSGPMVNLSGGEMDMVGGAFALAIAEHHAEVDGVRWETAFADEADGALTRETSVRWVRMLRRAIERLGVRQLLIVTHNEDVQRAVDQTVRMADLEV